MTVAVRRNPIATPPLTCGNMEGSAWVGRGTAEWTGPSDVLVSSGTGRKTSPGGEPSAYDAWPVTDDRASSAANAEAPVVNDRGFEQSAEAEGFEPSMGFKAQTALAVRRHRPD